MSDSFFEQWQQHNFDRITGRVLKWKGERVDWEANEAQEGKVHENLGYLVCVHGAHERGD